ncbi:MAG: glycosyltransferase family 1 protein [Proteobacteria bacterium]|nr:glycosyltransferase family 1 protein [Pseudomonadota bacterium]
MAHADIGAVAGRLLVGLADRKYLEREWAAALALYRAAHERHPAISAERGLPLMIGHCAIEAADPPQLETLVLETGAVTESPRSQTFTHDMLVRAKNLASGGEYLRASRLLNFLASWFKPLEQTYGEGLLTGSSDWRSAFDRPDNRDPPVVAAERLHDLPVQDLRARYAGRRLLVVARRSFFGGAHRQYDVIDNLARTATEFGLAVREHHSHPPHPFLDRASFIATLQTAIDDFQPAVILFEELFAGGFSAEPEAVKPVTEILASARARFGTRIITTYTDAWDMVNRPGNPLYTGLGELVDVVHHCHPAALDQASPEQRAATCCFTLPTWNPGLTSAAGTIPRGCFIGSMSYINMSRLAWWVETQRAGLPIDFIETFQTSPELASDRAYMETLRSHQLSINLTRRATGATILTGRTIETMLAGGVLVEEDSVDTRYFFKPGIHFMPFKTLADLREITAALLDDPARRHALAAEGHRWAAKYCTGTYFWAAVLAHLG